MSFLDSPSRGLSRSLLALFVAAAFLPGAAAAESVYHTLVKGETLYSVARSYGVKPEAIEKANSISDPAKLRAGTKLLIPGAASPAAASPNASPTAAALKHKVEKGDTLFSIAKAYGVSLDALRAANKLAAASVIKSGDILAIPEGGVAPASADGSADQSAAPSSVSAPAKPSAYEAAKPSPAAKPAPASSPAMPDPVKTSAKAVSASLSWPCEGQILYLDGKAYGIVIRARLGDAQKAIAAGVVSSAGPYRGYGNVAFVLSRSGYIYVYGGNESLSVRAGDRITAG
jgi:LysM repeat protein